MNKNKKIIFGVIGVVILAGVFYGGMIYGKNQNTANISATGINRTGQFGAGNRNNRITGGGFVSGEIISKDNKSITVKIMNGDPTSPNTTASGSKIIFFGTSTEVAKTVSGSVGDLIIGNQISITGTPNTDGSITAKTIQIRPQMKTTKPIQ